MNDCIFCKIIKGELPCYKVYEDDLVLAFLDINPLAMGHTLIIPKEHSNNLTTMDTKFNVRILEVAKKISNSLMDSPSIVCTGVNLHSAVGSDAGQVIFHTHFHVIPRYLKDGIELIKNNKLELNSSKFNEILDSIRIGIR